MSESYSNSTDKDTSFHESNYSDLTSDYHTDTSQNNRIPSNYFQESSNILICKKEGDLDFTVNLNVSVNEQHELKNSLYHKPTESAPSTNQLGNLNGLLNVVHSISSNSISNVTSIASTETKKSQPFTNKASYLNKPAVTVGSSEKRTKKRQNKKIPSQSKKSNLNDIYFPLVFFRTAASS